MKTDNPTPVLSKPVSRQRKWQIKKKAEGLCVVCGKKAVNKERCEKHAKLFSGYVTEWEKRKNLKVKLFDGADEKIKTRLEHLIKTGASKDYIDGYKDAFLSIGFIKDGL